MADEKHLASPHSIIWEYYECLNRQIHRVPDDENDRTQKQELVLALFLSVSVVETFLNAFFRGVVEEDGFKEHRGRLLNDIEKRISLEAKLKEWPKKILGKELDLNNTNIKQFIEMKNHRNALMHFVSSHESIELPGPVFIHGLADMSVLQTLTLSVARKYPSIIRNFSNEVFLARGIKEENLTHAFHRWFGEPPSNTELHPTSYVGG